MHNAEKCVMEEILEESISSLVKLIKMTQVQMSLETKPEGFIIM